MWKLLENFTYWKSLLDTPGMNKNQEVIISGFFALSKNKADIFLALSMHAQRQISVYRYRYR